VPTILEAKLATQCVAYFATNSFPIISAIKQAIVSTFVCAVQSAKLEAQWST
jgi:hypothetical protein